MCLRWGGLPWPSRFLIGRQPVLRLQGGYFPREKRDPTRHDRNGAAGDGKHVGPPIKVNDTLIARHVPLPTPLAETCARRPVQKVSLQAGKAGRGRVCRLRSVAGALARLEILTSVRIFFFCALLSLSQCVCSLCSLLFGLDADTILEIEQDVRETCAIYSTSVSRPAFLLPALWPQIRTATPYYIVCTMEDGQGGSTKAYTSLCGLLCQRRDTTGWRSSTRAGTPSSVLVSSHSPGALAGLPSLAVGSLSLSLSSRAP